MTFDATGTIGGLPCEIRLNQILAERNDAKLTKRVVNLLAKFRFRLRQLSHIPDAGTREYLRNLMRWESQMEIGGLAAGAPEKDAVASHAMCCVVAYLRQNRNWDSE